MKERPLNILCTLIILILSTLAGCGGGAGTGGAATEAQPTAATITLSTQGSANETIRGITLTLTLPKGVVVQPLGTGPNGLNITADGNKASTANFLVTNYTAATTTTTGSITFSLVNTDPAGFGLGDFATVYCTIVPGAFPSSSDFQLSGTTITDLTFSSITSLSVVFSADIR